MATTANTSKFAVHKQIPLLIDILTKAGKPDVFQTKCALGTLQRPSVVQFLMGCLVTSGSRGLVTRDVWNPLFTTVKTYNLLDMENRWEKIKRKSVGALAAKYRESCHHYKL